MEVRNCRGCKRLFNYLGGAPFCPACASQQEELFQRVKEYLREYPNSSIEMVSEDNDVSVKQIKQWVREERLTFSKDSPAGIGCEMCGALIKSGRFCGKCKGMIKNNLAKGIEVPKQKPETEDQRDSKNRMRYLE